MLRGSRDRRRWRATRDRHHVGATPGEPVRVGKLDEGAGIRWLALYDALVQRTHDLVQFEVRFDGGGQFGRGRAATEQVEALEESRDIAAGTIFHHDVVECVADADGRGGHGGQI